MLLEHEAKHTSRIILRPLELEDILLTLTIDHPCMSLCSCHCRGGNVELVKYLIIHTKADVTTKDKYKKTPLHIACS